MKLKKKNSCTIINLTLCWFYVIIWAINYLFVQCASTIDALLMSVKLETLKRVNVWEIELRKSHVARSSTSVGAANYN